MSMVAEVVACGLTAIGFIMTIVTFRSNEWEKTDTGTVLTQANTRSGGIWEYCMSYANSGTSTCSTYDSFFLGLPLHLQAARAFSITSLVLGGAASLLTVICISGSPCASENKTVRNRLRMSGGFISLLAGISIIAGVSWFAVEVMRKYYNTSMLTPEAERLAFGSAIFVGWIGGALSILGGLLAVGISCPAQDDDDQPRKMAYYRPSQAQEYV